MDFPKKSSPKVSTNTTREGPKKCRVFHFSLHFVVFESLNTSPQNI